MHNQVKALGLLFVSVLLLAACTTPPMDSPATNHAGDHSQMADAAVPFDLQFIDGMTVHHEGAITMAEGVLAESERPELLTMAEQIIRAQQAEIEQMQEWRTAWYRDAELTATDTMEMGDMQISDDASLPFDQRFLTAMIAHHQGALAMATDALTKAEHPEIKTLASAIIAAQQAEIAQMEQWLQAWFGAV